MRRSLHLDMSEIATFFTRPKSEQCDETVRHLLKCRDCRSLLTMPTTKEFWRAVLEDRVRRQEDEASESLISRIRSRLSLLGEFGARFQPSQSATVVAVLFLLIIGFSLSALMFGRREGTDDHMLAQAPGRQTTFTSSVEEPLAAGSGAPDPAEVVNEPRRDIENESIGTERRANSGRHLSEPGTKRRASQQVSSIWSLNRSETRGSGTLCGEGVPVSLEMNATELGLKLNWGKVPQAISYTVYLSDLEERLIDQFETPGENSYVTTRQLDPETIYRWKLVVDLKDGRKILATSRNFRFRNSYLEIEQKQSFQKRKLLPTNVRCMEGKK